VSTIAAAQSRSIVFIVFLLVHGRLTSWVTAIIRGCWHLTYATCAEISMAGSPPGAAFPIHPAPEGLSPSPMLERHGERCRDQGRSERIRTPRGEKETPVRTGAKFDLRKEKVALNQRRGRHRCRPLRFTFCAGSEQLAPPFGSGANSARGSSAVDVRPLPVLTCLLYICRQLQGHSTTGQGCPNAGRISTGLDGAADRRYEHIHYCWHACIKCAA
jgi:hypothetical protein